MSHLFPRKALQPPLASAFSIFDFNLSIAVSKPLFLLLVGSSISALRRSIADSNAPSSGVVVPPGLETDSSVAVKSASGTWGEGRSEVGPSDVRLDAYP